jgi:hypothetical protein
MEHTKGEWKISPKDGGNIKIWAIGTPKIAIIPDRDVSFNEQISNAKLIAASPKMLEALLKTKELIGFWHTKKEVPTQETYEFIENAIKKATE